MLGTEVQRLKRLLDEFLGEPKADLADENSNLEYSCPRCRDMYGPDEDRKYNLSVNIKQGVFNCWKCSSMDDDMHGSIFKLIKRYGNDDIYRNYVEILKNLHESNLYNLDANAFALPSEKEDKPLELPTSYHYIKNDRWSQRPLQYLAERGIGRDIINKYRIGYTSYNPDEKAVSNRIILPSYDVKGRLNYWTGRDFTLSKNKTKYFNPNVDRKSIIFNEGLIDWDCDVTLVEGPFDSIVYPNCIPLLGKKLNDGFKLYYALMERCNANINIFLDGDAQNDAMKLYKQLNQGVLYDRIRFIPVEPELDPSEIFQRFGKQGIIDHINSARRLTGKELILA